MQSYCCSRSSYVKSSSCFVNTNRRINSVPHKSKYTRPCARAPHVNTKATANMYHTHRHSNPWKKYSKYLRNTTPIQRVCLLILGLILVILVAYWLSPSSLLAYPDSLIPLSDDVTLVTHLSVDRLPALKIIAQRWQGPMAVCFYVKAILGGRDSSNNDEIEKIREWYLTEQQTRSNNPNFNGSIDISIYHSSKHSYPVNTVRNRALQLVSTKLAFIVDADFVPDTSLYGYLKQNTHKLLDTPHRHRAWVVPAFQQASDSPDYKQKPGETEKFVFPDNKIQLLDEVKRGNVMPMFEGIDDVPHIRATNLPKWYSTSERYRIHYEDNYEPYVVVSTAYIPPFDEKFSYYGNDKISFLYELYFLGFEYWVIPDHFIVHYPHKRSAWANQQAEDAATAKKLMQQFKQKLVLGRRF